MWAGQTDATRSGVSKHFTIKGAVTADLMRKARRTHIVGHVSQHDADTGLQLGTTVDTHCSGSGGVWPQSRGLHISSVSVN